MHLHSINNQYRRTPSKSRGNSCLLQKKNKKISKQHEKVEKYYDLAVEFRKMHEGIKVKRIPIVVGAFGMIPKRLPEYLEELGIPDVVGGLQKTALLGTRRILKNVLSI